jgi:hypothetical protein
VKDLGHALQLLLGGGSGSLSACPRVGKLQAKLHLAWRQVLQSMLIILLAMSTIGGYQSWERHRYGDELRWLEGDLRLQQDSLPGLGCIFHNGAHMRYTFRFNMR